MNAALRKENRELARANAILSDAAALFGAALDRQEEEAAFVAAHRHEPEPFVWHKTADEILDSLANYCNRISDSGHSPFGGASMVAGPT